MEHTINAGDTAWMLVATALVLMMTPALGFFYGGMARKKNVLSTLNLSVMAMSVISLQWVLAGYSLAFGTTLHGFIGGFNFLGLRGVGAEPLEQYAPTIPHLSFSAYQMMFAVITPALITGAFIERIRFKTFLVFIIVWTTLVYDPVAHWVWGIGGVLRSLGALDFAGGTVVHVTAGFSALAFSMVIRQRRGFGATDMEPHHIPYSVLGAGLLWFGWFGFNGGSALAANGLAVTAIVNTNTAAAAAGVVWMLLSWNEEKPGVLGIITGAVVGLVAITPAAGYVTPLAAICIGAASAPVSYYSIKMRQKWNLDESLDVWACHGMGGVCGALLTGVFASKAVNSAGADGLLYGNPGQLGVQCVAVAASAIFACAMTYAIAKLLDGCMGLSVSENEEIVGLDISEHGERAYS